MKTVAGTRWLRLDRLFALATLVALTACGGGGNPTPRVPEGARAVEGQVVLPAGHALNLGSLSVVTTFGSAAVGEDGSFTAFVVPTADVELSLVTAAGELVLLGTAMSQDAGTNVELSVQSTAEALLYYSLGGMWLPPRHQTTMRELLQGVEGSGAIADELTRLLAAGGNGLAEPDAAFEAALLAAHQALLPQPQFAALAQGGAASVAPQSTNDITPRAAGDPNILIHNGTSSKAGAQVLHNPGGSGIVVINEYRRPAALLIYAVAWEDEEGVVTPIAPPDLAATIDVPATGKLELFNALWDAVSGGAPFAPVVSPAADLTGHPGAAKTHYELVLIGPSLADSDWPIVSDERFAGLQEEWEQVFVDKSIELFTDELLLPIVETYMLGRRAGFDAAQLKNARERMRIIYKTHLKELGAYLSPREARYAQALRYAMQEMRFNLVLRNQTVMAVLEAMGASDRNKMNVDAANRNLAAKATASGVAAALQGTMLAGDVTGILYGMTGSAWAVNWQAESTPKQFMLTPELAQLEIGTKWQERFEVYALGPVDGDDFLFRWTTSGDHGLLSDYLNDGIVLETDSPEVLYTHENPAGMMAGQTDTITVEVFAVEVGATTIPADAEPISIQAATVTVIEDDCPEPYCDYYYCWCDL